MNTCPFLARVTLRWRRAALVLPCLGLLGFAPAAARAQATATANVVHRFNGNDGANPIQGPIKASDGNFYGCVAEGGMGSNGTIYKLTPGGQFSVLHNFGSDDGREPRVLIQARDGNLYGLTNGTFFRLGLDGAFAKLYDFDAATDRTAPSFPTGLVQGGDGNFYGVTRDGGANFHGTFFRVTPDGRTLTVLYPFTTAGPGGDPSAQLVVGRDGNFYGTTSFGGTSANASGSLYMATQSGTVTPLHLFASGSNEPEPNMYPLIQGTDGAFYGIGDSGGDYNGGAVYRYNPSDNRLSLLHSFQLSEGEFPFCSLTQGSDGNFYGALAAGPDNRSKGIYFQVTPGGTYSALLNLDGTSGGPNNPEGNLAEIGNLVFFGLTKNSNDGGDLGTVVQLTVTGATHPAFFNGEANLGNGVYYLAFGGTPFGYYSFLADQHYIFHFDLGYEYVFDAADGKGGVYLYDFASGSFFYTSPSFPFPYLYDFSLGTVLYYFPDTNSAGHYTTNPRYFLNTSTGQIFSK